MAFWCWFGEYLIDKSRAGSDQFDPRLVLYEVRDSSFRDPVFGSLGDFDTAVCAHLGKARAKASKITLPSTTNPKQLPQIDGATSADWRTEKLPYSWTLQRDAYSVLRGHRNAPMRLNSAPPAMRHKLPMKRRNIRGNNRTRTRRTRRRRTTKGCLRRRQI